MTSGQEAMHGTVIEEEKEIHRLSVICVHIRTAVSSYSLRILVCVWCEQCALSISSSTMSFIYHMHAIELSHKKDVLELHSEIVLFFWFVGSFILSGRRKHSVLPKALCAAHS